MLVPNTEDLAVPNPFSVLTVGSAWMDTGEKTGKEKRKMSKKGRLQQAPYVGGARYRGSGNKTH